MGIPEISFSDLTDIQRGDYNEICADKLNSELTQCLSNPKNLELILTAIPAKKDNNCIALGIVLAVGSQVSFCSLVS